MIDFLDTVVEQLDRRGNRPHKLIVTAQGSRHQVRRLLDGRTHWRSRWLGCRGSPSSSAISRLSRARLEPIAIEDLLGRPQAVLDRDGDGAAGRGRRLLVTGAGGTIGSELARQIAALSPGGLSCSTMANSPLYAIDLELRERFPGPAAGPLFGDVRDRVGSRRCMAAERPEVVFHAAA